MTRLVWDQVGSRRFEAGLDRGVLYTTNGAGVAWNGLTSVKEGNSGGEITSFYLDGVRYLSIVSREEIDGTIEAFTYPDEFGAHDGTKSLAAGLIALQQARKPFGLSYRTRIGNDLDGQEAGYKIHLIYNVLASPSEKTYGTSGDRAEAIAFSWNFSAVPRKPKNVTTQVAPLAHVIIDSTRTSAILMRYLEEQLYGSYRQAAKMISLDDLFRLFENPQIGLSILVNRTTGLSQLQSDPFTGDLLGDRTRGLYDDTPETRLRPTIHDGMYTIGTPVVSVGFTETATPGYFTFNPDVSIEDTADPGTYTRSGFGMHEDPNDPGTYANGI